MPGEAQPLEGRCLNCEAELVGDFCHACGQRALPSRLAIGELLREVLSETFELDGRVVRTLVPFLFRPGFLTREYIAGRRARYTSPFRLFLAATLLWLFASFVAGKQVDLEDSEGTKSRSHVSIGVPESANGALEELIRERAMELEQMPEAQRRRLAVETAHETLPKAALLTLPVFALLMKLLFIRRGRYYVEHLVFALHVHAFAFVLFAIIVLTSDSLVVGATILTLLAYVYVALWKAYEARWWTSALRLLALGLVHTIVLACTTGLLVLATMLFG